MSTSAILSRTIWHIATHRDSLVRLQDFFNGIRKNHGVFGAGYTQLTGDDEGWHCIYAPSPGLFLLVTNKVSIGVSVEIRNHGSLVITTFGGNTGQDGLVTDVFAELKLTDK